MPLFFFSLFQFSFLGSWNFVSCIDLTAPPLPALPPGGARRIDLPYSVSLVKLDWTHGKPPLNTYQQSAVSYCGHTTNDDARSFQPCQKRTGQFVPPPTAK